MKPLRIVFMGSPDFAVPALRRLTLSGKHHLVMVVTGPDKKRGRGSALSPTPVKAEALKLGLPILESDSTRTPAFFEALSALKPDLLVVVAFKILPKTILAIPEIGSINIHASLLPKYRGAAPIHWAVINGDRETGNTIFMLNEQVDAGGILASRTIPIGTDETTGSVYSRLMELGAEMLPEVVDGLAEGRLKPIPQTDEGATPAPKVFPDMAEISFQETAEMVHNRIRGFSPNPGAWVLFDGMRVKLFGSRISFNNSLRPGEAEPDGDAMQVGCSNGAVSISEIQFPGKNRVSAGAFLKTSDRPIHF